MAGFEGPREPGAGDQGSSKLPTWAVTRGPSEDDDGAEPGTGRVTPRAEPPISRVPEHPFDIDDPFGDKQLGGTNSPWIRPPADDTEVRVVDLADEFHLTTAQALEVCAASGTPATSGAAWLTVAQADAFRTSVATYDRTDASSDEYPDWAVPPGGARPPASGGAAAAVPVPGATLLAGAGPSEVDDVTDGSGGGRLRLVLLVVALLVIAALVAMLLVV